MKPFDERKRIYAVPMFLVAIAGFSYITMLLWNALLPEIFKLPQINFWQAAGLLVLSRLLFGFNVHWGSRQDDRRNLRKKWDRMSPEERETFKNRWNQQRSWWKSSKENIESKDADVS